MYKTILSDIVGFIPYALGWAYGKVKLFVRFLLNTLKAGYLDGIGDIEWQEYQKRRGG